MTTSHFLSAFALETPRDLPKIEALEDAGLLSMQAVKKELAAEKEEHARA